MSREVEQYNVLNSKDVSIAGWRCLVMLMHSFNYEVQMGTAVVYTLAPALRKIYPDDEDFIAACNNHYAFYNSQPYMTSMILGAALAMEDRLGKEGMDAVANFKAGIMGPLAGIGDTVFWVVLPTIFRSIMGSAALEGESYGVYIYWIYCLFILVLRLNMFRWGFKYGTTLVERFRENLVVFTDAAGVVGIMLVGAMIPKNVGFKLKWVINTTSPVDVQSKLDTIMPYILPVALTGLCYWLINKKKINMVALILILIAMACVGVVLGIL